MSHLDQVLAYVSDLRLASCGLWIKSISKLWYYKVQIALEISVPYEASLDYYEIYLVYLKSGKKVDASFYASVNFGKMTYPLFERSSLEEPYLWAVSFEKWIQSPNVTDKRFYLRFLKDPSFNRPFHDKLLYDSALLEKVPFLRFNYVNYTFRALKKKKIEIGTFVPREFYRSITQGAHKTLLRDLLPLATPLVLRDLWAGVVDLETYNLLIERSDLYSPQEGDLIQSLISAGKSSAPGALDYLKFLYKEKKIDITVLESHLLYLSYDAFLYFVSERPIHSERVIWLIDTFYASTANDKMITANPKVLEYLFLWIRSEGKGIDLMMDVRRSPKKVYILSKMPVEILEISLEYLGEFLIPPEKKVEFFEDLLLGGLREETLRKLELLEKYVRGKVPMKEIEKFLIGTLKKRGNIFLAHEIFLQVLRKFVKKPLKSDQIERIVEKSLDKEFYTEILSRGNF